MFGNDIQGCTVSGGDDQAEGAFIVLAAAAIW